MIFIFSAFTCNGGKTVQVGKATPRQIIVKFKSDVEELSVSEFISSVEDETKVRMEYVRPMSGDAHVFRSRNPLDQKTMEEILQILKKRIDIEYAEEDQRMQTLKP